jgi:glycosyltransferase involved in cell wall biosynthesis
MKPPALDMPAVAERLGPVAVLSTYSPSRDGIARYADQFVAELVKHGGYVRRVGVAGGESGGDELVDVAHGARFLRVVRRTPHDQTVLVMWHPAYFTGGRQLPRIAAVICLAAGFRMRRTIVLQHEPDDDLLSGVRGLRRPARLAEEWLRCVMWRAPVEVWFHSDYERNAFRRRYPAACKTAALEIVPHGATFAPETAMSQAEARHRLGVPIGERMFVCVGFLSIHKGIDRVVRAFSAAAPPCGRLWIVG